MGEDQILLHQQEFPCLRLVHLLLMTVSTQCR